MLTELFVRYFFGNHKSTTFLPSEDRLDFLNIVVWLLIGCILLWVLGQIL